MELAVFNIEGKDTGRKASLSEGVFGVEPNNHVVYLEAKYYLANQRQGTHKVKVRSEIKGSTKKIKKQKGTGTARAGSIKSPLFRGGGRVFGPEPRNYGFKLNKKVRSLAAKSVLSAKVKSDAVTVLEQFTFEKASTKSYANVLKALKLDSKKTLLVLAENDSNVVLSGRNIAKAKVTTPEYMTTYDVLNADNVIVVEGAVEKIENRLK